jgi:hypothetical protein
MRTILGERTMPSHKPPHVRSFLLYSSKINLSSSMNNNPSIPAMNGNPKKNVTDEERKQNVAAVLARSNNGVPKRGAFVEVASYFPFTVVTVSRIWHRAAESAEANGYYDSPSLMKGRCGRRKSDRSGELERLRDVPIPQRSTIRSAAAACGLPPTTLYRHIQAGSLCPAASMTKPLLTDANKLQRLQFCLSHVGKTSRMFDAMYDVVHADEKLFYVTEVKKRFYLLHDKDIPYRALKQKSHITKVMFLAAVARPRWNGATNTQFGGLIGI